MYLLLIIILLIVIFLLYKKEKESSLRRYKEKYSVANLRNVPEIKAYLTDKLNEYLGAGPYQGMRFSEPLFEELDRVSACTAEKLARSPYNNLNVDVFSNECGFSNILRKADRLSDYLQKYGMVPYSVTGLIHPQ